VRGEAPIVLALTALLTTLSTYSPILVIATIVLALARM
jgi:hypothetical protein